MQRTYLEPDQRATLRARLGARAAQLGREIEAALHGSGAREARGLPNHGAEVDDDAVADLETGLDVASVERDARELDEVNAALARIDQPSFGACAECGEPISWPRLCAQPQARRCIACESVAEKRGPGIPPREI
jgi:DnaK suppressor protein